MQDSIQPLTQSHTMGVITPILVGDIMTGSWAPRFRHLDTTGLGEGTGGKGERLTRLVSLIVLIG